MTKREGLWEHDFGSIPENTPPPVCLSRITSCFTNALSTGNTCQKPMNRPSRRGDSKNSRPKQKAEKERAVTRYQDEAVFHQVGSTIRTCARVGIGIRLLSPAVRKSIKAMGAARIGAGAQWHSRFVEVFQPKLSSSSWTNTIAAIAAPRSTRLPTTHRITSRRKFAVARRQGRCHCTPFPACLFTKAQCRRIRLEDNQRAFSPTTNSFRCCRPEARLSSTIESRSGGSRFSLEQHSPFRLRVHVNAEVHSNNCRQTFTRHPPRTPTCADSTRR